MANLFPEEEIESLRRELERHNRLYYVEAKPEITDREYDALMAKLMLRGTTTAVVGRANFLAASSAFAAVFQNATLSGHFW